MVGKEGMIPVYDVDVGKHPERTFFLKSLGKWITIRKVWFEDYIHLNRLSHDDKNLLVLKLIGWSLLHPKPDVKKVGRIRPNILAEISDAILEFSDLKGKDEAIANLQEPQKEE